MLHSNRGMCSHWKVGELKMLWGKLGRTSYKLNHFPFSSMVWMSAFACDRKTRKSSKVESTYWRFFKSQVFRLTLHDNVVLYWNEQCLTPAPQPPIHTWRLERREASYTCVVLVVLLGEHELTLIIFHSLIYSMVLMSHLHVTGMWLNLLVPICVL